MITWGCASVNFRNSSLAKTLEFKVDENVLTVVSVEKINNFKEEYTMEKYAWKGMIMEGALDEYIKRHNEIWPEMVEVLKAAGIKNYTIWNVGCEMFGYYECEKGVEYAAKVQAESPVVDKWNEYMKDILIMEKDPVTGAQPQLEKVFEMN